MTDPTIGSTPFARRTMVRNFVRRDVGQPDRVTNQVIKAGVQTSYVHASKIAKATSRNRDN